MDSIVWAGDEQREAFINEQDVFVSFPVGSGKSLCHAILSMLGCPLPTLIVTLCVSPLVSLMQDQKEKCSPCGLVTEYFGDASLGQEPLGKVQKGLYKQL